MNVKYFSPGIAGVPRWVLGVAVGVPVAAALIYILFGPSSDDEKKKTKKTDSVQTGVSSQKIQKNLPKGDLHFL